MKLVCQEFSIKTTSGKVILKETSQEFAFDSLVIMGKSGEGKTTFLNAVLQRKSPHLIYSGSVSLVSGDEPLQLGRDIRVIPQLPQHSFEPQRTVGKQLAVILKQQGSQQLDEDIEAVLRLSRLEKSYLTKFPYQLSGGQLQRLIYSLALVNQPKLIVADEPTSALDKESVASFKDFMARALEQGSRLILTTHDVALSQSLAKQLLVVDQAELTLFDQSELAHSQHPFLEELRQVQSSWEAISFPKNDQSSEDTLVQFSNVAKVFEKRQLFAKKASQKLYEQVSFDIKRGDVIAICGKNGSGKSTLIKLALGLEKPTTGEITLKAESSLVFQNARTAIDPTFSVFDTLKETDSHLTESSAIAWLQEVGLAAEKLNQSVRTLSGGEQQRLSILRTLVQGADIIYFDEPFSSLDMLNKLQLFKLLISLREKYQLTYVIITHEEMLERKVGRVFQLENQRLTMRTYH